MPLLNSYLMVPGPKVDFAEELGAAEAVQQLVDPRDRVPISPSVRVQRTVVDAHAKRTVLLPGEQDRVTIRTGARTHPALLQELVQLTTHLLMLPLRHTVHTVTRRRGALVNQVDTMPLRTLRRHARVSEQPLKLPQQRINLALLASI